MTAEIRRARAGDGAAILALVREIADYHGHLHEVSATPQDFERALCGRADKQFCEVVELDGALIGYAIWYDAFTSFNAGYKLYLEDLYVVEQHRGGGYGAKLMQYLAQICLENGYSRMEWVASDFNKSGQRFYERLGAKLLDDTLTYQIKGEFLHEMSGDVK